MREWRVNLGIIGGLFLHLVIGTMYITGNISVYLVSYLRTQGEDVSLQDAVILLPIQVLGSTVTMSLGAQLVHRLGTRAVTTLGNSLTILAVFCGSFCKSFWSFCLVYAALFGLGEGLSYMPPLIMGWSYYPQHKGRISGLVLTFFALGTSIFSFVSTAIINPDNRSADIKVKRGGTTDHYYSTGIADGFPAMLRWLSLCYLCLSVLGVMLMAPIKPPQVYSTADYEVSLDLVQLPCIKEGVKSRKFGLLFAMGLLTSGFGMYLAAAYKSFGSQEIDDDSFLAATGSVSFFMNGLFRIIFAQLMDFSSFKLVYGVLISIQIAVSVTLDFVAPIKALFLVWVSIAMACEGGHFSLFSAVCAKLFGKEKGGTIFGLLFSCFGISSVLGFVLQFFLVKLIGYIAMFMILSGTAGVGLLLLLWRFKEKSPWLADSKLVPIAPLSAGSTSPR